MRASKWHEIERLVEVCRPAAGCYGRSRASEPVLAGAWAVVKDWRSEVATRMCALTENTANDALLAVCDPACGVLQWLTSHYAENMKADGASVLALAARLGMAPREAAWLYQHDFGAWRYYLVTPDSPRGRPLEAYGALAESAAADQVCVRVQRHRRPSGGSVGGDGEPVGLVPKRSAAAGQLVEGLTYDETTVDAYLYPVERGAASTRRALKKTFRRAFRDFVKAAAA